MKRITAIIPTFNEQHNIVDAIKSVDFADEIMVVDSFSKDATVQLATPLADTILQRECCTIRKTEGGLCVLSVQP